MKLWRAATLALALGLGAAVGHAQTMSSPSGAPGSFYLRAEGGWNHAQGIDFSGNPPAPAGDMKEDEGYIAGGAVGYNIGAIPLGNLRIELNLDYRDNGVKSLGLYGGKTGGSGNVDSLAGMVNGIIDAPIEFWGIRPYYGLGAGLVSLNFDNIAVAGTQIINDRDTVAALQGIAGLRYDLTTNWTVGLEYRFLDGFNPRFHTVNDSAVATEGYRNHSILLNVTYSFGAPPPPPPPVQPAAAPAPMPAPAPAPAATVPPGQFFIVFFDFDKSTITAAGRQVLDAAVAAFKQNKPVRIELTGFTDTVGTVQYNLGLSERRADAVRDYLAAHGVPASAMDVAWKGKSDLRVPTPDGVREPQNRRVEIVIPQ